MSLLRSCLGCDGLLAAGQRHDHRNRGRRPTDSTAWKRRRRADVTAHVAAHGWWCPGWRREPHESRDLTSDHVLPTSRGGAVLGETQVLCRGCNSRKRDRLEAR